MLVTPIEDKFTFRISLRFDFFFALRILSDPSARLHASWRDRMQARLHEEIRAKLSSSPPLWINIPDLMSPESLAPTFDEIRRELAGIDLPRLQRRFFQGLLHEDHVVDKLLKGADLEYTLNRAHNSFLALLGLYPADPESPAFRSVEQLLHAPDRFREMLLQVADAFWTCGFEKTWDGLLPQLTRSLEVKERLFHTCSLHEFAKLQLLRLVVDEKAQLIRATRSEYTVSFPRIEAGYFSPSAFNDQRAWTVFHQGPGAILHIPCFDPTLAP